MKIEKIINSYFEVNSYLFEYNNYLFIVDPGSDLNKIIKVIDNRKLDYILLTHGHMDHIGSVKDLVKLYDSKVYASEFDKEYINGDIILDPYFNKNNYRFNFIDYSNFNFKGIKIINTPGHSKGSVCILLENEDILFSGDTLFKGSFGRFDFPLGNFKELKNSINYLFSLNENIKIYPGHGEISLIKDEKVKNMINFY